MAVADGSDCRLSQSKLPPRRPALPPATGGTSTATGSHRAAVSRRRPAEGRRPFHPNRSRDDAIASASLDDLNRNSPLKPVFFRARQQRAESRDGRSRARRERRACSSSYPQLDHDRSKVTATNAAPPSIIWRWANAARGRARLSRLARDSRAIGSRTVSYGKEFPVRSGSRRNGVRRRTGARISSSLRSEVHDTH